MLDELPDAARREMLAERFVPGHDIDELVDQIAARAGGNAFFIQELLDTLIERGILVARRRRRRAPGPAALGQARRADPRAVDRSRI